LGGVIGGVVGGWLGDWAHRRWPYAGRCSVAQLSLFLGATVFIAVGQIRLRRTRVHKTQRTESVMKCSAKFWAVVSLLFLFNVVACWTPVAALRPICGDIVRDSFRLPPHIGQSPWGANGCRFAGSPLGRSFGPVAALLAGLASYVQSISS
ncbi:yjjL, partial [Symbiodinium sp. CCMP2456]